MKTRRGFVSNSSSSSFLLITTKENSDKALAQMSEIGREYIEHFLEKFEFAGIEVVSLSYLSGNYGDYDWESFSSYLSVLCKEHDVELEDLEPYGEDSVGELLEEWKGLVSKDQKLCIRHSEDF